MVIDLADASESVIANGPFLRIMGAVIVCSALIIVALGAFVAISGRPLAIGRRHADQQAGGKVRWLGLAQVLFGAGGLMLGSQGFLSLSWLSRTVVLGLAAILITTGGVLQVWMAVALARK